MKKSQSRREYLFSPLASPPLKSNAQKIFDLLRIVVIFLLLLTLVPHTKEEAHATEVEKLKTIYIHVDSLSFSYETRQSTVRDILKELNFDLATNDALFPSFEEKIDNQTVLYIKHSTTKKQGTASWYAKGLSEPQNFTAASRDYPRGTKLEVTSLDTGEKVTVTVNDYGPEAWTNRIIDLSLGAFEQISAPHLGLTQVEITPL